MFCLRCEVQWLGIVAVESQSRHSQSQAALRQWQARSLLLPISPAGGVRDLALGPNPNPNLTSSPNQAEAGLGKAGRNATPCSLFAGPLVVSR
jgi:hypothetical protein